MEVKNLKINHRSSESKKLTKASKVYEKLLEEMKSRDIPDDIITAVSRETEAINNSLKVDKLLAKEIRKATQRLIKILAKQLKLVPKNHFLVIWIGIGMSIFGIPIGVSYGVVFDNMAFMGVGIGVGLAIGMAIGAGLDKKALKEGRQLDIDYEI